MRTAKKSYRLDGFPGIPFEYIRVLESEGIKNTLNFLSQISSDTKKIMLSRKTGIPVNRLDELESLSDLVRINGIGHITARILYEAGIKSITEFASSDYQSIYAACSKLKKSRYNPMHIISDRDIKKWILEAQTV